MTNKLKKLEQNYLYFTLTESITKDNPNLILIIEDKVKYNTKQLIITNSDLSTNPKFNKYSIELVNKIDEDLENFKIYLKEEEYNYYVWECDTLTINKTTDNIIEKGYLYIK